ncbi:MAG: ABC transporter permease, partial [Bacteroidota bacterium]
MANRLLWVIIGFLILALTYFRFSFTQRKQKTKKGQKLSQSPQLQPVIARLKALPQVRINDRTTTALLQFWHQIKMEFWGVAKSTPFLLIISFGILNMMGSVPFVNEWYGTGNHPVTYLVVDAIRGTLYLFIIAILMYYAGVLVWKEREAKMNELFDAAPFPTWIPFTSKLLALIGLVVIILIVATLFGMTTQAINGYTHFELGVYLREFLVYDLLQFIGFIILALTVQVMVNNKYLGYFAFLVVVIAAAFGPAALKINSNLFGYMRLPNYIYSDMNAWSDFTQSLHWFLAYWLLFAGMLAIGSILFWVRGKSLSFGQRQKIAQQRFRGQLPLLLLGLAVLWVGTGGFLFYQTKVLNTISHQQQQELRQKEYELKYKQYEGLAQPRIVNIKNDLALFPKKRNFALTTTITAQNKSNEAIRQIHFSIPEQVTIDIDLPKATIEQKDDYASYWIYNLQSPLLPGDSINFQVKSSYQSKGIENELEMSGLVDNGSFLVSNDLLPTIGYNPNYEITSQRTRKGHQLPARERAHKLHANCSHACSNTYISTDSDWVNISSTISTSADQIAVAPGTLVKEWEEAGRRYFQYTLKKPVLNFYAFVSARYEVLRETWTAPSGKKVDVEVYYHKGHKYNVEKMADAVKDALTYCTHNFLPYPHEQ